MLKPDSIPDFISAEKYVLGRLEENLSPLLFYHDIGHTRNVLEAAMFIAANENISDEEKSLLRIAVALHDSGFLFSYNNHEEKGCDFAKEILPEYNFSKDQVEKICHLIMATKSPQTPQTLLERIICDADLDYLGRAGVEITANKLFEELKQCSMITTEEEWVKKQIDFLASHKYFTSFSLNNREQNKQAYIAKLREMQG